MAYERSRKRRAGLCAACRFDPPSGLPTSLKLAQLPADAKNTEHAARAEKGLEWNKIVKKVANWRAKWAVKLKRFVEEAYPTEFNAKALNREVELLLQGEDPYAAMATAQEEAAAEKDELDVKDEGGVKMESFEPATSFSGARPGWCFKMGREAEKTVRRRVWCGRSPMKMDFEDFPDSNPPEKPELHS
ncbi:unnamed protein product [Durusdinium trenchii]|uniref:Uncharacterized protein n=1 Tax=Durusdinium trenchii TaxID=1381693 RepID=A0ABP0KA99_9DINO